MSFQQFNQYPCLTPARLVAVTNQSGTYVNGPLNNGVGATFTYATGALTIDSVTVNVGDRVLLAAQSAGNENGIYVCTTAGATGVAAVLTRAADLQCTEQLLLGSYVSVSAGTAHAGATYTFIEPRPARFGIDDLDVNAAITSGLGTAAAKAASDDAQPSVASVNGATTANALAVFADTAGTVKDASTTTTLGQVLNVSSSTSSATPGTIRALKGLMTGSNAVMTSGNLVGVRGEVDYVGASGGFIYGLQGKIIPTGTLSGSSWNAGVFGQLDISAATINAGQAATIWGDYGATSHTLTDQTGLYGIAMTNTTAAVLQGQLYLYGGAQNLMDLNTNSGLSGVTYFKDAGVSAGSWGNASFPTVGKVLKISVDGTAYYLPLVAQNT